MIAAPGSTLWLLRHELRLNLRGFLARRSRGGRRGALFLGLTIVLICLVAGVPLGLLLRRAQVAATPVVAVVTDVVLGGIFLLMLSQTLYAATDALYDRADLDLLFSSPLQPRRVMTVRFLGVAATVSAVFAGFISPLLLPVALIGHPAWLSVYPVLLALGLTATAAGLALSAALFRLIGPRRTRTVGQVLAAIIGAGLFLFSQSRNILGAQGSASLAQSAARLAAGPGYRPPPFADWPLRAMLGDPLPLGALTLGGAAIFLVVANVLGRSFAADAAAAAGASAGSSRRPRRSARPFAEGPLRATFVKELRLLARDPALIAQVLLRVLFLVPLGAILLRQAGTHQGLLLPASVGALCLIASQIAGSLAWIVISGEDAPDLIAASPAPPRLVDRAKLAAALAPLAVLMAPIVLPLIVLSPWAGVAASLGASASAVATALLNLWWQRPGKRSEFRQRRSSSWFVTTAEALLGLLISGAAGLLAARSPWAAAPALAAAGGLLLLRRDPRSGT